MTTQLLNKLVAEYKHDDEGFAARALSEIDNHYANLPPSTSKMDPQRLGPKAVTISKLKKYLMEKLDKTKPLRVPGNLAEAQKFNLMTLKEQLRFQIQHAAKIPWLREIKILPENLQKLKASDTEMEQLKKIRSKADTEKLQEKSPEVDAGRLMQKLLPFLTKEDAKWTQVASALLLATGRRTVEVLKLGKFYVNKQQSHDGYRCMFSGQAKQKIEQVGDYEIPLLAPYSVIAAALARLRKERPTNEMTAEEVNTHFGRSINSWLTPNTGLTPHQLRASYAKITYGQIQGDKMSLIGHISKVLGHVSPTNSIYYQRLDVKNIPKAEFEFEKDEIEELTEQMDSMSLWDAKGAVETKRLKDIEQQMAQKLKLTANSLRNNFGGAMATWQRILSKNEDLVEKYHKSL